MLGDHPYYWLLASLPALPPPERVTRLPINAERLAARLRPLPDADRVRVQSLQRWLLLLRSGTAADDAAVLGAARPLFVQPPCPVLATLVADELCLRTVLAALRRRARDDALPADGFGVEPWAGTIRRCWRQPDFGLSRRLPWVATLADALAGEDMPQLTRAVDRLRWRAAARAGSGHGFDLPALLCWLVHWHILDEVLARDVTGARARFVALVSALTAEHVYRCA